MSNNKQSSVDNEFVLYEEALALKELGFDEPCFAWHVSEQYGLEIGRVVKDELIRDAVLAPTFSQTFRFFRETYEWQHSIEPTADQQSNSLGYNYWVWNYRTGEEYYSEPKNRPVGDWEYEKHEESEIDCLKKLIEIQKGLESQQ